jgi:hypothetical protein
VISLFCLFNGQIARLFVVERNLDPADDLWRRNTEGKLNLHILDKEGENMAM